MLQNCGASQRLFLSEELTASEGDLQGTQKELDAANAYFEKLKPVPGCCEYDKKIQKTLPKFNHKPSQLFWNMLSLDDTLVKLPLNSLPVGVYPRIALTLEHPMRRGSNRGKKNWKIWRLPSTCWRMFKVGFMLHCFVGGSCGEHQGCFLTRILI